MDSAPRELDLADTRSYGAVFADVYDAWYHDVSDHLATAEFVAERCPSGTVLELGVGSGRLAGPLLDLGLQVIGVDTSQPMLQRCSPSVRRVAADMARLPIRNRATGLTALCGFNTLFNLPTAKDQMRFFAELGPIADVIIVETFNPAQLAAAPASSTGLSRQDADDVVVSSITVDPNEQKLSGRHLSVNDRGIVARPWALRWASVDQLDDWAAVAGFECSERYGSWTQDPFEPDHSATSISVYSRFRLDL